MALLQASYLGIERFANDRDRESWQVAAEQDRETIIRAVYRQVLGQQYLMENERLSGAESLFRNNYLTVRELVRTVAKSGLYRERFFENCNPYRFIELNHKHLLGRAPQNREEMLAHFTILQEQGVDSEIDSYIDSSEYVARFGEDGVPYIHGWDYTPGHQGRQFSWLMQLARGSAASVKGDASGTQFRLGAALHQNRPAPVVSPNATPRLGVAGLHRSSELRGPTGNRDAGSSGGRVATITISGVARNSVVRSADYVIRVPVSRMNEALQRANRLGGKVREITVQ
ncbi:phycobilisome linker polypeptide [Synechococcus sp. RSCCF101]|uniref:phycobilisome rod-core linker polypeptide n=1 Tax=Synechococcus sp. RSCCF101 TaxID=2511069 RepID=UPI001249081A|nr:phycobilisome rod-core linker polypeptide [Synechococcus sp. RSCCF101]QEY32135.1 phycobilisome linker polypeptide [Synechococcus sp. RSCCF101]